MANNNAVVWVLTIAVVFMILWQTNIGGFKDQFATTPTDTSGAVVSGDEFCEHDGITLTIGPVKKAFSQGTSMSAVYHRLYLDGSDEGLLVNANTKALSPYDDVTIIYAENDTTYYATEMKFKLPCKATLSSAQVSDDAKKYQLYQQEAGTLSHKCFNDDDNLMNSATNNESLGANDKVNIDCSIQGTSEDAFSPYGGVLVTLIYNNTAFDELTATANTGGWTTSSINTPDFRVTANVSTGYTAKTFYMKKSSGVKTGIISNEKLDWTMAIDVDDTNQPQDGRANIDIYYDDEDWFQTDEGVMAFGPEDTDGDTDVGLTTVLVNEFYVD